MRRSELKTPIDSRKLVSYADIMERYTIGRNKAIELSKKADAVVAIGRMKRVNVHKMDAYIDSLGA